MTGKEKKQYELGPKMPWREELQKRHDKLIIEIEAYKMIHPGAKVYPYLGPALIGGKNAADKD